MSNVSTQAKPAITSGEIIVARARFEPAPDDYVPLTPELLLLFCQTRLRQMDTVIEAKMQQQKDLVGTQKALQDIQSALKGVNKGANDELAFNDEDAVKAITTKIDALLANARAAGNSELVTTLESVRNILSYGDAQVTKQEVKDMSTLLDNASATCRSGAEISMIELQSLVSARATQLQLTTGLMTSMNDTLKTIAGNIAR